MADTEKTRANRGFIQTLGDATHRIAGRMVPDPFVLAVALTILTLLLGVTLGSEVSNLPLGQRLIKVGIAGWFNELISQPLLAFAFQMIVVLVTGHALALSPPVQKLIDTLSKVPRSSAQAAALVAFASCIAGYINWGLGAVTGAILAREIGRAWSRIGRRHHYPLLGAAAYSGFLVWHGGLSGTAPLKIGEAGHFLSDVTGVVPTSQTLFAPMNLVVTAALITLCTGLYYLLAPREDDPCVPFDPKLHGQGAAIIEEEEDEADGDQLPIVRLLERSAIVPFAIAGMASATVIWRFYIRGGAALDLNLVNLMFFAMGLAFHGSPRTYMNAAGEGARGAVGIVLQFPLYFGILGMLKASGLIVQLSDLFVSLATETTLPVFIFLSAGVVNLFVPSGGGQWAVQGPVMMSAAKSLGVDPAKAVMALAYGDAWTNMLQPFWALPLLAITGLKARDIIGYTTLIFLASAPVIVILLLAF